jgi:hypothetical protein
MSSLVECKLANSIMLRSSSSSSLAHQSLACLRALLNAGTLSIARKLAKVIRRVFGRFQILYKYTEKEGQAFLALIELEQSIQGLIY